MWQQQQRIINQPFQWRRAVNVLSHGTQSMHISLISHYQWLASDARMPSRVVMNNAPERGVARSLIHESSPVIEKPRPVPSSSPSASINTAPRRRRVDRMVIVNIADTFSRLTIFTQNYPSKSCRQCSTALFVSQNLAMLSFKT